jgi:dTDP-4-amino-4,6-dideoxygalactose transaminase
MIGLSCPTPAGDHGPDASLPMTDEFARREVTLPLYPGMSDDEVDFVSVVARDALVG